jgi:hypothetical protein
MPGRSRDGEIANVLRPGYDLQGMMIRNTVRRQVSDCRLTQKFSPLYASPDTVTAVQKNALMIIVF